MKSHSMDSLLPQWLLSANNTTLLILTGFIISSLALLTRQWTKSKPKIPSSNAVTLDLPTFGSEDDESSREAIEEGYRKFPDSPFHIRAKPIGVTIVPPFYLEEMKKLPESQVSFKGEEEARFHPEYTGIGVGDVAPVIHAIQVNLTRDVDHVLAVVQEELPLAFKNNLPECEEWTPVVMYEVIVNVVALVVSRLLVGLPLSRNERWLDPMRHYLIDAIVAEQDLWKVPQWSLPLTAHFIPKARRTMGHKKAIRKLIAPLLAQRLKQMKQPDFKKPADVLQTIIDFGGEDKGKLLEFHTECFCIFALSSFQGTAQAVVHMLYDIVAHQDHLPALREELETILAEDGGKFVKSTMPKLRKLDSFMKESQRVNFPGLITITRWIKQDTTFSDGTTLQKGSFTAVCAASQNMDPRVWDNPGEFDGFRFEKIRQKPGFEQKYQFVSTSVDALTFGHGSHQCPGRFFVNHEIKMLLGHLFLNYDLRLPEGQTERPKNVYKGLGMMTDFGVRLMVRKRR